MSIRFKIVPAIFSLCLLGSFAAGDVVTLRDGQKITGTIIGETAAGVTIDAPSGRFTFPRTRVLTISRESPIRNELRQMEKFLSQGNLDSAVAFYHAGSLADHLSAEEFNAVFLENLKNSAVGATATSETAILLATKFSTPPYPTTEVLLLVAAISMRSGDQGQALKLLGLIENDIPGHLSWTPDTVSQLLDQIASLALKSRNGTVVAAATGLASKLPIPQTSSASKNLVVHSNIRALIRDNHFLTASAMFKPEMFLHRADLFVPLAEQFLTALFAAPASPDNLAALESAKTTVFPYVDKQLAIRGFKLLVTRLAFGNRTNDAQQSIDELAKDSPDIAAHLQHLLDFHIKKQALPQDSSPMDKYQLSAWARSMGLPEEARALFMTIRSDPRFTETVSLQLELIDHAQGEEAITRLRRLFNLNDFERLKLETSRFLATSPPETFARQAKDLVQLADFQVWSSQNNSRGQAEAEFQQAERLANRREFDEALMHLNRIRIDNSDTQAAAKSQALRDKIMLEKLREARRQPAQP